MKSSTVWVRLPARGAVLVGLMLVASACSDEGSSASTSTATSAPADAAATTTLLSPTVTVPIDAAATLQQGLAGLASGYHFHSVVTVNGVESLSADGDRIGDSTRLTLTRDGGKVAYIITPTGSFAQPEFGDWEVLDVAPATADPITALNTPLAVAAVQADGAGNVVLRVTVAAVSLGIASEGNADVDVTLANGIITRITYSATVGGSPATTTSEFGPVVDASPIVAPI